jgi:hypothetical protein
VSHAGDKGLRTFNAKYSQTAMLKGANSKCAYVRKPFATTVAFQATLMFNATEILHTTMLTEVNNKWKKSTPRLLLFRITQVNATNSTYIL